MFKKAFGTALALESIVVPGSAVDRNGLGDSRSLDRLCLTLHRIETMQAQMTMQSDGIADSVAASDTEID